MMVGNYFKVSASSTNELMEGQHVKAKYLGSAPFLQADVELVHEDGSCSLNFEPYNAGKGSVDGVPREDIKSKSEEQWRVVVANTLEMIKEVESCVCCLVSGELCAVGCDDCESAGCPCDRWL